MHLQPKIGPAPTKNRYVGSLPVLCTSIAAVAVAAPFPAMDFTGIIYFIYAFFASLLFCAFYVKNRYGKIALAIPALLVKYTHSRNVFVWEVEEARIIHIAISFLYAAVILLSFVHTKGCSCKDIQNLQRHRSWTYASTRHYLAEFGNCSLTGRG